MAVSPRMRRTRAGISDRHRGQLAIRHWATGQSSLSRPCRITWTKWANLATGRLASALRLSTDQISSRRRRTRQRWTGAVPNDMNHACGSWGAHDFSVVT
jgi:hypothetical protein